MTGCTLINDSDFNKMINKNEGFVRYEMADGMSASNSQLKSISLISWREYCRKYKRVNRTIGIVCWASVALLFLLSVILNDNLIIIAGGGIVGMLILISIMGLVIFSGMNELEDCNHKMLVARDKNGLFSIMKKGDVGEYSRDRYLDAYRIDEENILLRGNGGFFVFNTKRRQIVNPYTPYDRVRFDGEYCMFKNNGLDTYWYTHDGFIHSQQTLYRDNGIGF